MKQKIVMKVQMNCQKCRSKAMEIAACAEGVDSVAIQGKDQDQLMVIGNGVDPISLGCLLRKKVGHTKVLSVQEVKAKEEKIEVKEPHQWIPNYQHHPHFITYKAVYEPEFPSCSIM